MAAELKRPAASARLKSVPSDAKQVVPKSTRTALARSKPARSKPARSKPAPLDTLARLAAVVESRRGGDPDQSYVARLLSQGENAILKKIGEEATETVMAAKDGERDRIVGETADLWFHCLVMLAHYHLGPDDVLAELARREGLSGLDEKAARKARAREKT